jgi:hypothetical protein
MTDLPDGQISRSSDKLSVQLSTPFAKNISLRDLLDAALLIPAVPPRLKRGVSRSSRTWSAGCGGRGSGARRAALTRMAKSCGPDAPTLASTGDDASHHAGMVTTSPVHQGEHEVSRKTIAQGRPDRSGEPVVYLLVCFLFLHTRLRAHQSPGFPCALFSGGTRFFCITWALSAPRDREAVSCRHCEERKRRSNPHVREAIHMFALPLYGLLRCRSQ